MYLNDQEGDCGPAACGHAVGENSLMSSGAERIFADGEIDAFYRGVTGGPDSGVDNEAMFNYWRQHGIGGDQPLVAYAALQQGNTDQLDAAMEFFEGAVILGLSLPDRVVPMDGTDWTTIPWTGTSGSPDPNNGHDVSCVSRAHRGGPYTVASWAAQIPMDAPFYGKYCDQPSVVLTAEVLDAASQKTGAGYSLQDLLEDVAEITGQPSPYTPPPPAPGSPCPLAVLMLPVALTTHILRRLIG
jgi:hypothetical protein